MPDLAGKRLELLREIIPDLRRLAILTNVGNPIGALEMGEVQAAARTLGLEILPLEIRRAEDIGPAFDALKDRADALYVVAEPLLSGNHVRISTLALGARLPTLLGIGTIVVLVVFGRQLGLPAWPFVAAAMIFGLWAWWLFQADGAEHSLLRAMAASRLLAVAIYAVVIPSLEQLQKEGEAG